jgi:stage III sporulation protein SpoIIIAA
MISDVYEPSVGDVSQPSFELVPSIGFCKRPVPGKTTMLLDLSSCLSGPSRGLKPKTFVQVSTSSVIAGITNFSTFRELRAFENKVINSSVIIW